MNKSQFCILWNNFHNSLVHNLEQLLTNQQLVNVTLACHDGNKIFAHQLVLAASSSFFKDFFETNPSTNPIVLLPGDMQFTELKAMVEFMYKGQVCIQKERLQHFIRGAQYFKIQGLEEFQDSMEDIDNTYVESTVEVEKNNGKGVSSAVSTEKPDRIVSNDSFKSKDHGYTQKLDLNVEKSGNNWENDESKPIVIRESSKLLFPDKKKRKRTLSKKKQMYLSSNIVCYEKNRPYKSVDEEHEPINKIRRFHTAVDLYDDDMTNCSCSARKTWSLKDTEALLIAWKETLSQVPPSYFIRSVSLCRNVASRLQMKGVRKNWRQCQIKMKNLRKEVKINQNSNVKHKINKHSDQCSSMTNADQLLPYVEDIFNKEEEIRQRWYSMKGSQRSQDNNIGGDQIHEIYPTSITASAVLGDSDIGDDEADMHQEETENELEVSEVDAIDQDDYSQAQFATLDVPHHRIHSEANGTVTHIVENVTLHIKEEEEREGNKDRKTSSLRLKHSQST